MIHQGEKLIVSEWCAGYLRGAKVERIEEITRALAEAIDAPADEGAYAVRAAHLA